MGVLDTQREELHMGMELYKFRSDRREDQLAPESYMGQQLENQGNLSQISRKPMATLIAIFTRDSGSSDFLSHRGLKTPL